MKRLSGLLKPKYSPLFLILFVVAVFVIDFISLKYYVRDLDAAVFQSPLPNIVVAKIADDSGLKAYLKQYDFTKDMFTRNIPIWEKVLEPYRGKANISYLEVGTYEGRSVIWVLENILTDPTAKATAIDIFQDPYYNGAYGDKYFANIELSGSADKVTTIADYSQIALRKLPFESFDIIYIDGSHAKNDVLEDAVLSWRLLKKDGLLIFDDYRLARFLYAESLGKKKEYPKIAIDAFAQCFDEQFEIVHNDYQLILRRIK